MIPRQVRRHPDQCATSRVGVGVVASAVFLTCTVVLFLAGSAFADSGTTPERAALDWDGVRTSSSEARQARDKLHLTPSEVADYRESGTWHDLFDTSGVADKAPVLVWILALIAVGLIGLPYVWVAGAALPDRGFAFARPVGLLLVAWLSWWLASAEVLPFSREMLALVAGGLGLGGIAIVLTRRREMLVWVRQSARLLAVEEAVFWVLFAAFLAVRWANPDLWHPWLGGEKPMDLAYLNAVVKSDEFPPYDPWFAGGYINYYYFGFVIVGALVKATAIAPHVAYNLAVPTLAAFLGAAVFGACLALQARTGGALRARTVVPAGLASLFVVVIGNLGEVEVLLERARGPIRDDWWFWTASRAITPGPGEPGPITEFPAFTYLFADLHAHAIALPYAATALGLALGYIGAPTAEGRIARVGRFLILAIVVGALWVVNTWDLPTYAALAAVAILLGAWAVRGRVAPTLVRASLLAIALAVTAYLAFFPFHDHYRSTFHGFEIWRGGRTSLGDYLTVHGFFLFLIASALVADLAVARDLGAAARALRLLLRSRKPRRVLELHRALVGLSAAYVVTAVCVVLPALAACALALVGELVAALIIALLALTVVLLPRRARASKPIVGQRLWQMTLVLVACGLLITLAVEYVVVKNIDIGRTNTVFKSYLQVWVLWGIAAAVGARVTYEALRNARPLLRVAWHSAFVVLFAATLLYPALATPARIHHRFDTSVGPTLDGTAFMTKAVYSDKDRMLELAHDLGAIRWMLDNVDGSPVVAELNTSPRLYGWGNRFAMFTGNPAIIGWDFHQRQQRGAAQPGEIERRIADVQEAYRTRDPERAYRIFRRYDVEYLVVGDLERAYFPRGQKKWATGVGTRWDLVYRNEGTQIYRMRQPGAGP
jgi:YYY domain-containing protein